ncbi:hypothetical protein HX017_16330 [Myroides marinus]|uniref:beta-1,6-N-acetylglucosaminyltransferase n=1 Tax=Myroides marinus TaxID=703342 RepID=UPI0025772A09|nr:beta-1,6-N-acetylglucosaminyltransferase [Myroides marinus]MDM1352172.1 hypothetical protein [Myroides marinus]MDM1359389.1 hypothetical protein [Myroides marinus]MDM1366502.1 hypothetical protein [Myroides marinus]
MRLAFLIQCHTDVELLNRFICKVKDYLFIDLYVHVDAKSSIINEIVRYENLFIIDKRIDVKWGTFSQIEATLELMKVACGANKKYDYISLISGQDYLCKSISEIVEYLVENKGKEFIEICELPKKELKYNGGIGRVSLYWPSYLTYNKSFLIKLVRNIYLQFIAVFLKKEISSLGKLYYGSSWFTLSGECVEFILQYLKNNPSYIKPFKSSGCGDEVFFQTLIMNSNFKEKVVNKNLRFIRWEGDSSPIYLNENYYEEISYSECFFVRKVSTQNSLVLLDLIDNNI